MASFLLATDIQRSVIRFSAGTPRAYTPYGLSHLDGGPMSAFCGERRDDLTGCYHLGNGHRLYNPTLMRFVSSDSASPFGRGGVNAYAYCGADPVNNVDPTGRFLNRLISAVSMLSSSATAAGAVTRTARSVVHRLDQNNPNPTLAQPNLRVRLGNIAYFYTGAMGVSGTALRGVEQGWVGNMLGSNGSRLGLSNALGNIFAGSMANFDGAADVWQRLGRPGVSAGRVAWETFYEVTGARLVMDGASYAWEGARNLGGRLASTYRSAAQAWRNWAYRPSAPPASPSANTDARVEMNQIRST
jgi:RHS repeat-associated protein